MSLIAPRIGGLSICFHTEILPETPLKSGKQMLSVPHFRQARAFTCGPACLRMALAYYDIDESEADIADAVGCTTEDGTPPPALSRYLRQHGFIARSRKGLTLADIAKDIKRGRPSIIAYQAWAQGVDLANTLEHGHYSILVSVTRNRVSLCDPSAKTKRIHVPAAEFLARWRDVDSRNRHYVRWGLTVSRK